MKRLCLIVLLLHPTALVLAQGSYQHIYDAFRSNVVASFEESARDMCTKWERHIVLEGLERSSKPPVDSFPETPEEAVRSGKQLRVSEVIHVVDYAVPLKTDSAERRRDATPDTSGCRCITFSFYGQPQTLFIPRALGSVHPSGITEDAVAAFWRTLSQMDVTAILQEAGRLRSGAGYNDWAILSWVQQLSHVLYPQNRYSECTVFSVYLLTRMGLMARMARAGSRLTLLFAAKQTVYGRKYVVLDTYPFYLADPSLKAGEVFTYGEVATWHTRPLDLRILEPVSLGESSYKSVHKASRVFGKSFSLPLNLSLVAFYSDYPQLEAREYVLSQPDPLFKEAILKTLRPLLEADKDDEPVNRLLEFLQKDFAYKVDTEQFGYEKPFFPEENFFYAYNDCEDRSVLFSFLAWNLLNLKTVLLDYEDHMAVAVCLGDNAKGDYVKVGNDRYYVCDPSYVNAPVGVSMPHYRNRSVTVWVL